ncbi:MAG: TetR/AcrR family transcriptional regulator [Catalinimonas sp.]
MSKLHAADKRADVLRATLRLVGKHGFHGTSVAMILQEAGAGAGTLYRYFDGKEGLIVELYREIRLAADQAMLNDVGEELPVRERFMRLWHNRATFLLQNADYQAFMEQFELSPFEFAPDEAHEAILTKVELFFEEARAQQFMKDEPSPVLEAIIFAPLRRLVTLHHLGRISFTEDMIRNTAAACWDAVRR